MTLYFVLLYVYLLLIHESCQLLCYNGTLNNHSYEEDTLQTIEIFNSNTKHMARLRCSFSILCKVRALLCYNCSSTQHSWDHCGGDFILPSSPFNSSRYYLINCTKEHSMCFLRSWRARDRNAWIVQRGCYQMSSDDVYPKTMNTPLRSMTCKLQKLTNAEYKTCLCSADWCNSAMLIQSTFSQFKNVYNLIYLVHAYNCLN